MKTWSALLLAAALIGLLPLSAAADDVVVARVNGVDIKQSDLDFAASEVGPRLANYTAADRKRVLLQYLIENELMAEAGQKDNLDKAPTFPDREKYHERRALRDANARVATLERSVEVGFNRYWGLTFKEGNENSRFGEQIEVYACIYTSRVSNFVFYSPMQYFRSPRAAMAHERAAPARISPWGDEHGAPVAGDRPSKASKASR